MANLQRTWKKQNIPEGMAGKHEMVLCCTVLSWINFLGHTWSLKSHYMSDQCSAEPSVWLNHVLWFLSLPRLSHCILTISWDHRLVKIEQDFVYARFLVSYYWTFGIMGSSVSNQILYVTDSSRVLTFWHTGFPRSKWFHLKQIGS